jgi:hypothetical protein
MARLEALCFEAIAAGEQDLLLGLDMLTASWLGLRFTFETVEGPFTLGEDLDYGELDRLVESGSPGGAAFALRCKRIVSEVFPRARIDASIERESPIACFGCGAQESAVMLSLDTGSDYCRKCWRDLTDMAPSKAPAGKKAKKRKRKGT